LGESLVQFSQELPHHVIESANGSHIVI